MKAGEKNEPAEISATSKKERKKRHNLSYCQTKGARKREKRGDLNGLCGAREKKISPFERA